MQLVEVQVRVGLYVVGALKGMLGCRDAGMQVIRTVWVQVIHTVWVRVMHIVWVWVIHTVWVRGWCCWVWDAGCWNASECLVWCCWGAGVEVV